MRSKNQKILRDCSLKGDGVHQAVLGIAPLRISGLGFVALLVPAPVRQSTPDSQTSRAVKSGGLSSIPLPQPGFGSAPGPARPRIPAALRREPPGLPAVADSGETPRAPARLGSGDRAGAIACSRSVARRNSGCGCLVTGSRGVGASSGILFGLPVRGFLSARPCTHTRIPCRTVRSQRARSSRHLVNRREQMRGRRCR